jgi:amino acid permease
MTVCGLLNGMIGGTILILPIIGISTGYAMILIIASFLGFISYYTANLIVIHLGRAKNMKECVLNHFQQNYSYMIAYALIIWSGQIPTLILYYNLICLQIEGILGQDDWFGIMVGLALAVEVFIIVCFNVGEETMGIGIVSIVSYILFVSWALITAPKGNN